MTDRLRRPDFTFTITVCPIQWLDRCEAYKAQERRGLIGFHQFESCPDCVKTPDGYEYWGQNGHRQGGAADRAGLLFSLKRYARERWAATVEPWTGAPLKRWAKWYGYRLRRGSMITYRRS